MLDQLAADLLPVAGAAVVANFALLAAVAVVRAPRTGPAGAWAATAFGSLAIALLGFLVPESFGIELPAWVSRALIALFLAFPYLLLRFTASFARLPRWLEIPAGVVAIAVAAVTLALPFVPEPGAPAPPWSAWYVVVVLAYWVLVSVVTVVRLWRAGRAQPTVARRRMRLMSAATAALAVALLMSAEMGDRSTLVQLAVHAAVLASGAIFGLGFSPPRAVRLSWQRPEVERLQDATIEVLRATSVDEVGPALLPPTARIVNARRVDLVDARGRVVATHGEALGAEPEGEAADPGGGEGPAPTVVSLGEGLGELLVWTSPYTPFFHPEEGGLLRSIGAIAGLALERCALLEAERARRVAVEQAQEEAERAREEAHLANTAKTDFLSRMSHELRTPLNAVLGFGQLLETSSLGEEDRQAVGHILKAGRHLLALINDVLDLSRIEAGTLAISLEPAHTGELIHDTVALVQPLADGRSIRLTAHAQGCDVYVMTDRQRCRQILLNLLSNAVKYSHDGGEVDIRCAQVTDQALRVSVRDTGPGIDAARLERLFQPFERLGAERTGVEGTGLGLALTKQLVERLGGAIGVETARGEGATFWIDLPLTDRPADAPEPISVPDPAVDVGVRTLLLVEDNLANLRLVEAMLRRRPGISVLPVMQGTLALELAYQHRPDVIVLDLQLPDLPGREVLSRLQADPRTRDIPVVIASADATPGRVRQLLEEGAFDYIAKPLDLRQFLQVVDAALAGRAAPREHPPADQDPDPVP